MGPSTSGGLRRHFSYSNVMSTLAVFLVVAGGTALAATLPANSVKSSTVKNDSLKSVDLKDGKGVRSADVADASLTGTDVADASLTGTDITDGGVNTADLANNAVNSAKVLDNSITGTDVAADTLTGADIVETSLGQVPSAANATSATNSSLLGGKSASSFLSSATYKNESPVEAGTVLGATHYIDAACNAGDVMLSGGPANIADTTVMVESFPSPLAANSWRARVNKNGMTDNFSVVVLCANQ